MNNGYLLHLKSTSSTKTIIIRIMYVKLITWVQQILKLVYFLLADVVSAAELVRF